MMKLAVVLVVLAVVGSGFAQGPQGPPPFLAGAPPAVINEFKQLLSGAPDKTDAEIEAQIEQWVQTKGPQIQAEFNKFKAQLEQGKAQAEAAHQASIARFSPAAKDADAKLSAIAQDPSLKGREKQQKIAQVIQSLSPEVKAELQREMQG